MIPRDAIEPAARAIEEGILRDDSVWTLATEALQAGFPELSRELDHLRFADRDAIVNRDTVNRLQEQLDAIENYIRPENWFGQHQPRQLWAIQKIIDGEDEETFAHRMTNLRGETGNWVAECICGQYSSGQQEYAGNAVGLVSKHVKGKH